MDDLDERRLTMEREAENTCGHEGAESLDGETPEPAVFTAPTDEDEEQDTQV